REDYTRVVETSEHGGYPLLDHVRKILQGPIVWAPGVKGAVVMSMRGGDFAFESGQDLSVGYLTHDLDTVTLYLEQSFSFRVLTPEAAVAIVAPTPPTAGRATGASQVRPVPRRAPRPHASRRCRRSPRRAPSRWPPMRTRMSCTRSSGDCEPRARASR